MKDITSSSSSFSSASSSSSPFTPVSKKTRSPTPAAFACPLQSSDLYRRVRSFSFASSSSSSSSPSSPSSVSQSPPSSSPSPFYTIPFSWEKRPGIPKLCSPPPRSPNSAPAATPVLPLPPPPPSLRSNSGGFFSIPRKKRSGVDDPFALALVECSREEENRWKVAAAAGNSKMAGRRSKRAVLHRFGLRSVDLYGSCKATCSVADSAVYVSPVRPAAVRLRALEPSASIIVSKQYGEVTYD